MPIHEAHLPHLVTQVPYLGEEAHLFGDVVADAPEVVHETAAAKLWRGLDEQYFMTGLSQPVSEGRTGDARPIDDNPHASLGRPNARLTRRGRSTKIIR